MRQAVPEHLKGEQFDVEPATQLPVASHVDDCCTVVWLAQLDPEEQVVPEVVLQAPFPSQTPGSWQMPDPEAAHSLSGSVFARMGLQ